MSEDASKLDDKYMYEFCTKRCRWKECPKNVTCFDAHSKGMSRRVPVQIGSNRGIFNYIPEHCPQYKKTKKCDAGDACFRAHGWLEVIFHPLLYKTKLCESTHENGVCRLYGIYCAKAHKRSEMRDLVKIYGENWKAHYDTSKREIFQRCAGGFVPRAGTNEGRQFNAGAFSASSTYGIEAKNAGSSDMSDYIWGGGSLYFSIENPSTCERSVSTHSPTSEQSPTEYNTPHTDSDQSEEHVVDYTDLYIQKPEGMKTSPGKIISKKMNLRNCSYSDEITNTLDSPDISTGWSSYSRHLDVANDLDVGIGRNPQLFGTESGLFSYNQVWGDDLKFDEYDHVDE